ncbi:MAG TPA: adenylate/guanylate cyclase domain-containing protein, partial [Solirubrobacteraceae bacterium]|nr:adenylate/guanylate cyclase domain-containing protein [Solirubrobacteraceae bacterium]
MTRIETAIIVATDLVGSTELASRVGSLKFEELRREHDSLLGDDIEDAGGHVVKNTGDGLLAAFPSVTSALAASVAVQQHLDRRNRTAEVAMTVRIGISIGDAAIDEGDYFGIPPIEATRLCRRARGGEILIADPVRAMLRDRQAHRFESAGALELKGLPEPVLAWTVGWEPLPEPAGTALPARLRGGAQDFSVGRRAEQELLLERWDQAVDGHRQVVLISGEPGIGKTHLVTQAARTALPDQALVLYGRCDEDQGMPYHPWVEVLR